MFHAIGLMSGTSLDGVDAALIETDGERIGKRGPALELPYPQPLRDTLRTLLDRAETLPPDDPTLRTAEQALTDHHAEAVQALRARIPDQRIDVIGFHGQTLYHAPDKGRTWQIGDAARLSARTGLPVVHDFRSADVAAGGEGAPLAPVYHAALARKRPVAIVNIGGVANITLITSDGAIHACDTGPGNALLDDWAERHTGIPCDRGGALAKAGTINTTLLETLLADPFFHQPPPKSLDRLSFHRTLEAIAPLSPQDGAATLAAFTIAAIARTPLPERPASWHICGGGRHNPVLMAGLQHALPEPVTPVDDLGWDGDALEAECFGFLAIRSLRGLPLSWPGTTGVRQPMSGGVLTCNAVGPGAWTLYAPPHDDT